MVGGARVNNIGTQKSAANSAAGLDPAAVGSTTVSLKPPDHENDDRFPLSPDHASE